uniref:B2 bradykinin receptor-like n=1 Tax=Myxine glutinosa TaxID=7769 RepID=UPI00358F2AD9
MNLNASLESTNAPCLSTISKDFIANFVPYFNIAIFILGFLGNSAVILVLLFKKTRRTIPEIYFTNLAFADIIFVSSLPFWATNIIFEYQWPFGSFMCRLLGGITSLNVYSSIFLLTAISWDRCVALVLPLKAGLRRNSKSTFRTCLIIWILAFLFTIPTIVFRKTKHLPEYNITACILDYPNFTWTVSNSIILLTVGFVIPFSIMTFCSIKIVRELRQPKLQHMHGRDKQKRVVVLIMAVVVTFFFCWLPFQVVTFLHILHLFALLPGCLWEEVLEKGNQYTSYIAYCNSCLNPFLYVLLGKIYRKRIGEIVRRFSHQLSTLSRFTVSETLPNTMQPSVQCTSITQVQVSRSDV